MPLRCREYHGREDRTRLPELGKKAIEVRPIPGVFSSRGLPDVLIDTEEGQTVWHIDRDSSEIPMFGCDGPQCHGDPFDPQRYELKNHISELYGFGEVDGADSYLVGDRSKL